MPNNLAENVRIGICSVTFKTVDLGFTQGGVEVEVTTETHKTLVDQHGSTPLAENIMGRSITVRCPFAETTLENLVALMPGATLITDGIDPLIKYVQVTSGVGDNMLDTAGLLVLHPKDMGADLAEDFTVFKAATAGSLSFAYKVDEERIFNVEFTGYVDTANGDRIFAFGDTTATP